MKDKQRLAKAIIGKMIDYCDNIQELMDTFDNSYDRYVSEIAFQYSCNMCVLQIGELAARLSDEVKVEYPQIPWRKIKAMRNIHVHEYENVDFTIMWDVFITDIPLLRQSLEKIMEVIKSEETKI